MKKRMEDGTWKVKMLDAWEKDGWSDGYESLSYCSCDDEDDTQSDIDSETSPAKYPLWPSINSMDHLFWSRSIYHRGQLQSQKRSILRAFC